MTYRIADYGRMMRDDDRMHAYLEALRRVVRPERTVLDLGAGAGIFAIYAAKLGAKHVVAVDTNDAIEMARAMARDNGLESRITFVKGSSRDLELDDRVDVIIADLRGRLPLFGQNFELVADAKARFLESNGVLIPLRDHLKVAPVTAHALHEKLVGPWEKRGAELGVDLSRARAAVVGDVQGEHDGIVIGAGDVLAPPIHVATLEYGEPAPSIVRGGGESRFHGAGAMHGFALYFDAEIDAAARFSNAPGTNLVYGRAFLPLSRPVRVEQGWKVETSLFAHRAVDDYLWSWRVRIWTERDTLEFDEEQSKLFGELSASL